MSEAVLKICPSCETPLATCGCLKKVQRYIVRACDDSGWHLKTCEYPDMGGKWVKASDVEALQHRAERAEARGGELRKALQWIVNVEDTAIMYSSTALVPAETDLQALITRNYENRVAAYKAARKALEDTK